MKFFSCLVVVFTIVLTSNSLISGPITSGGGNSEAAMYQDMAYKIRDHIKNHQNSFTEIDLQKLDETIKSTQVLFVYNEIKPESYPSNVVLDAFSDGKNLTTEINLMRWHQKNYIERQVTNLHEYLVLMGIENYNNYFVSSRLFELPISFNDSVYEQLESDAFFRRQKNLIFNDFEWILNLLKTGELGIEDVLAQIEDEKIMIGIACRSVAHQELILAEKNFFKRIGLEKRVEDLIINCLAHFSSIFQFNLTN